MGPRPHITGSSTWKTQAGSGLSKSLLRQSQPRNVSQAASPWKMKKVKIGRAAVRPGRKSVKGGPHFERGTALKRVLEDSIRRLTGSTPASFFCGEEARPGGRNVESGNCRSSCTFRLHFVCNAPLGSSLARGKGIAVHGQCLSGD